MASSIHPAVRRAGLLIVEDLPDQQAVMAHALQKTLPELTVNWAADSPSAQTYLADCAANDQSLPRLILLDLYLPNREDGWHLVRWLKAHPRLARIPVVVLSRSNDGDDVDTTYELGVTSYIAKPHTIEDWAACFESLRFYWFDAVTFPSAA